MKVLLILLFGTYQMTSAGIISFPSSSAGTPQWNSLGPGLNSPHCSAVNDILIDGDDIYVAGSFTDAGGNPDADYIALWDGHTWHAIGPKLNSPVFKIAIDQYGFLYIAGEFTDAGGNPDVDYLAKWDRLHWQPVGPNLESFSFINTLIWKGDNLFVGGWFTDFAGIPDADYIARWDGQAWHAVGGGLNDEVNSIKVYGDEIYVGGSFTNAGGNLNADHLIRWDGTIWHALQGFTFGEVNDMAILAENLIYVTGSYLLLNWDGNHWQDLGVNFTETGYSMSFDSDYVYIGTYLALHRWHIATHTWDIDPPLQGFVKDLETSGSDLYAAGWFDNAGGNSSADDIARWGDPDQQLIINGVPNLVCQGDPPFELPIIQSGISGRWSGKGVSENTFYPQQVGDLITITFAPDTGQTFTDSVTADITVFHLDSAASWGFLPNTICESGSPQILFEYICPPGVPGVWSGPGMANGYFNPAGINGDVTLTFTPDFTLNVQQPINFGQCIIPPYIDIEVINFNGILPVIDCLDNNTPDNANDDIISIQLDHVGQYADTIYTTAISTGIIFPEKGNYNTSSYFLLQPGSAGGGNITLTLQDDELTECSHSFLIEDPGSCSLTSAETIVREKKSSFQVFPNPTEGIIWYTSEDKNAHPHTLTIMDNAGQKIKTSHQLESQFDLSSYPAGIYYLKYEDQVNCKVAKVMKY